MARDLVFDLRKGGGSSLELLYGEVEISPTNLHTLPDSAVLPAPTKRDLVAGKATFPAVTPTPEPVGGQIAWAYHVLIKDRNGNSWDYLVGVPDDVPPLNFNETPRYFETVPPAFGIGPTGPAGAAATVEVGTVTSGPTPSFNNVGTPTNAIFDVVLAKGDTGATGPSGTITSASASGLAAGATPTVTLGGTPSARTMAFGIPAGAQGVQGIQGEVGPTGAGVPAGGAPLQLIRKDASNITTEWVNADKNLVGLASVDNTADVDKPVSTPQQTALNLKADKTYVDAGDLVLSNKIDAQRSGSKIRVVFKTDVSGNLYTLARTFNRAPMPNLVRKEFSNRAELTKPAGAGFIPDRQTPKDAVGMFGSPFISNASGWKTSGTVGEIRGAQIKNGVIYHEFESFATSPAGVDAIGYRANGTAKLYTSRRGDTAASMVADGVVDSFSYGPILVEEGVAVNLMDDARWTYFQTEKSARVIIGTDFLGDTIVITTSGVSGTSGLTGPQCVALAQAEGMHNAILMDGGGSAQLYTAGTYAQPSSDASGNRAVPDFFMLNAELLDTVLDTGWVTVPYAADHTSSSTPLAVRSSNGFVSYLGDGKPTTGTFGTTDALIANIPQRFRHGTGAQPSICPGNGGNLRKVTVASNGNLSVVGSGTSSPTYIDFSSIKYAKQY